MRSPVQVYEAGAPLLATLALQLVSQGVLRLDAPIAEAWPAFGGAGKRHITLRALLRHVARVDLGVLRGAIDVPSVADAKAMGDAVAAAAARLESARSRCANADGAPHFEGAPWG